MVLSFCMMLIFVTDRTAVVEAGVQGLNKEVHFQLVVRSSENADRESSLEVDDPKWSKAWNKRSESMSALSQEELLGVILPLSDVELKVIGSDGETLRLNLVPPSNLVELGTGKQWSLNESSFKLLMEKVRQLRAQHYGTLLSWEEAQMKMPRKSVVQVTDLETGLSFRVQRRAGSQHADVQPMTKADTAIMKQIYGGEWSWKRRAIIISTDNNDRLAASMHGMPHGGDGIPNNDFSGHFCIHFLDSTTHKSDSTDLPHQLMAYKAAGRLYSYLESVPPDILAASFLEGVNQHDASIISYAGQGLPAAARESFLQQLGPLTLLKLDKEQPAVRSTGELEKKVELTALVARRGKKPVRGTFAFQLVRKSMDSPWRISDIRMR